MSTEEETRKLITTLNELTEEDIDQFIEAKFVRTQCPVCNVNDWKREALPNLRPAVPVYSINDETGFAVGPNIYPMLLVTCQNCGYVSAHMLGTIADWVTTQMRKKRAR